MSSPALPPAARTTGRVVAIILGLIAALGVVAAAWIGIRATAAYGHVQAVQENTAGVIDALATDPGSAGGALALLADDASAAHELTSDPVWRAAEKVPWVGPQLAAFAAVADSLNQVLAQGLTPIADSAGSLSLDSLRPAGGVIDTTELAALAEPARAGADVVDQAAASLREIDRTPLLGVVAAALDGADAQFTQVAAATDALAGAAALLPGMLGANGPRDYLVIVQNNAEWRSLGGIGGAGVLLRTDAGALSLTETISRTDFEVGLAEPVQPLPNEIVALFDTRPARYIQNVTQIPDFTVGAPLAAAMLLRDQQITVDGVIAVDPVVLSYLLEATGPVTLPTGDQLTSENAVSLLLNEVYYRYTDPSEQDAFFELAAGSVFDALAQGRGTTADLLAALGRASTERRLLIWSVDPAEEAVLSGSTLAGELPVTDKDTARFGVYLNDGTGSKMSYLTKPEVKLAWGSCQPEGLLTPRDLTLSLTLTSTAPADAATSLPEYITGGGSFGTPAGITRFVTYLYLPEGYQLTASSSTIPGGFGGGMHDGRQVLIFGGDLDPGDVATATLSVRATTAAADAEALVTPTADASLNPTVSATCGGLG